MHEVSIKMMMLKQYIIVFISIQSLLYKNRKFGNVYVFLNYQNDVLKNKAFFYCYLTKI
jgi:hypothetical protein